LIVGDGNIAVTAVLRNADSGRPARTRVYLLPV
jgi:hypothetical protein